MIRLEVAFDERLQEILTYLDLLEAIENEAQSGPPRLGGGGQSISTQQQRILYSSVYLQLYNLIESTVVQCLDELSMTAIGEGSWSAAELSDLLRKEWVKVAAKTNRFLTPDNRLEAAISMCNVILDGTPVESFKIERSSGSWDDESIERILRRIGCDLFVPPDVRADIKRKFRNDLGAMTLVRNMRNMLAHGTVSFAECGENHTVRELREMVRRTSEYLRIVVQTFTAYIDGLEFLVPAKRPAAEAAP